MISETRLITPADAQEMLRQNTGNYRKPCQKRVEALAISMGRGEWELNGETIKCLRYREEGDTPERFPVIA